MRSKSWTVTFTVACLIAMSSPARADQWDELAQKFVDQEHARFVRRAADKDGVVIVMEHPLVTERVVLVIMDGKAAMSFQFRSAALPDDDAVKLMGRSGTLITGKDAAPVMRALRECYEAASAKDTGVDIVSSVGLFVSCIVSHDGGGSSYLIAAD